MTKTLKLEGNDKPIEIKSLQGVNKQVASPEDIMDLPLYDITVVQPIPGIGIEIRVRRDGKVIWVNYGPTCVLRICGISSTIDVEDERRG